MILIMAITISFVSMLSDLLGTDLSRCPAPQQGQTVGDYVEAMQLPDPSLLLFAVNGRARPLSYPFADGDEVKVYPMPASG